MADYWKQRYIETLAKVEEAESPGTRSAYVDLASYYHSMRRFCETRTPVAHYHSAY